MDTTFDWYVNLNGTADVRATFTAEGRKNRAVVKLEEIEQISSLHRKENEDNGMFLKNPLVFTFLHKEHSILVSSHITSDLEKIADYIMFIHEGKVVVEKPKDELTEQYGIIKCGAAQFDALDKSDIIAYRKMDYEW